MRAYVVALRSDESPNPLLLHYESDTDVCSGDIIVVDGSYVIVDDVTADAACACTIECRRLWKLQVVDTDGLPAGCGFILNEQRHHADVDTLVFEGGERFRVSRVQDQWPEGFDGAFVVERGQDLVCPHPHRTSAHHEREEGP